MNALLYSTTAIRYQQCGKHAGVLQEKRGLFVGCHRLFYREVKTMAYSIVEKPPPSPVTHDHSVASERSKTGRYGKISLSSDIVFFGDPVRLDSKKDKSDHLANDEFRYMQWVIVVFVLGVILPALAMLSYLIFNPESFR
ncbi:hypothetical protein [Novipirellula sp.]|uniref:hypothetical protein n=1 Tax=Novipirellula sp. TaxID=2795430 RepID=UPI003569DDBC